jgi:putative FmdB family regulatory protein
LPRYDYKCSSCANIFELRQSFDSETVMPCPKCGSTSNRQFHAPPVIFKGSGWYVNDYGKGRGTNDASGEKKESESESGTKSESASSSESSSSSSSSESKSESSSTSTTKSD